MPKPQNATDQLEKPAVIIIGPIPPPYHGVSVSTQLLLSSNQFDEVQLIHLDTSDRRGLTTIAQFEPGNILLAIKHFIQFLGLVARNKPNLVYLPISQSAAGFIRDSTFLLPSRWLRIPTVIHLRGSEFPAFYRHSLPALKWLIRYSLYKAHRVIVLGKKLRDQFQGLVPSDRVVVIPNGTNDIVQSQYITKKDNHNIQGLFLSNIRVRKGIFEALEAAIQTLKQFPNMSFIFAGEWESPVVRSQVSQILTSCEVSERIHFVGLVNGNEKVNLLLNSDIFVFPPIEPEGHPRVILEAMAAGLPVITTDQGAISESVLDGQNGFIVKAGSASEIIEKIALLVNDLTLRKKMGKSSRDRFLRYYTSEKSNSRLAQLFSEVIHET